MAIIKPKGFRTRAALRETVEAAARKWLTADLAEETSVRIFSVNGGYEARSDDRGIPAETHELLATLPPIIKPITMKRGKSIGRPAPAKSTSGGTNPPVKPEPVKEPDPNATSV